MYESGERISQLEAEIRDLRTQLDRLTSLLTGSVRDERNNGVAVTNSEKHTDRRGLLKVAGAAAVGALGTSLLRAAPAAAQGTANGEAVQLGEANTCTDTTSITTTVGDGIDGSTSADGANGIAGIDTSTGGGYGVSGESTNGVGVSGIHAGPSGLLGYPRPTVASVIGDSSASDGVIGLSSAGNGVYGASSNAVGVFGDDYTPSPGGIGVLGRSIYGTGVFGSGPSETGYGVVAVGGLAPIVLGQASTAGPPTAGTHVAGEFYIDSKGMLWTCVAGGTPGTWVKQSPLVPLGPTRAYNSKLSDPLLGGDTRPVPLTSAGFPTGASVALVNVTIYGTANSGYLTLYSESASLPSPLTSNINWYTGGQIVANSATTKVSASGEINVYNGGPGSTAFIIDVFGYYW